MTRRGLLGWMALGAVLCLQGVTSAQTPAAGSIRGVVYDKDFSIPLARARVLAVETGAHTDSNDQGQYLLSNLAPGKYTLVFSKEEYVRQVKSDVLVTSGQLTDLDAWLSGDFTELEEFLVQDILQIVGGTDAALLQLRLASPALMDSISSDLMSKAGVSDAASALRLVAGASVQDGKSAVIRGLPDRYVSSQMNGVRLPTADEDKRAVELDQFPSTVIESIQVSKTFTPDQQGDASGGAVDIRLKGIPDESVGQVKSQISFNSQTANRCDFLTYRGGGVDFWGRDGGDRGIQNENLGDNWDGAAGVSRGEAPIDSKWSFTGGSQHVYDDGLKIGGLASFFYERDSSFYDNGRNDSYWVVQPGDPLTPQTYQGSPSDGDFKTGLFDVTQGSESLRWGGLGTFGVESKNHFVGLTYLYTRTAEDKATLAEDTRGKEYYFPGYDPNDPMGPGNDPGSLNSAPYLRLETLEYTERTTSTLQLNGRHKLPMDEFKVGSSFTFREPEVDWTLSWNSADLYQPDKRQFGALWLPASYHPGVPPYDPYTTPPTWFPYKPAANFNLGNFQRIWKTIEETSTQYTVNLKLPFTQWSEDEGYLKFGVFGDNLDRSFDQNSFSNFGDSGAFFEGGWDDSWSSQFPFEDHPITDSKFDVDYKGKQEIKAGYGMVDLPLSSQWNLIGGARFESTNIGIVNDPEPFATWFPPGATAPVTLNPGDADVSFDQDDVLPSIGLVYRPSKEVTLRGSYSHTVARQTFKELTPILQQEYLGGPIFIGNPELQMSSLDNYDLRVDYVPFEGGLLSSSWFRKDVKDPIEYVQRLAGFNFTTPVNYPEGELQGVELEARQQIGTLWESLRGVSVGANATFIDSNVRLPDDEIAGFEDPGIDAPIRSRDMTHAPEHIYNLFLTYDIESWGTQAALFYTVQGDTLVAGAGQSDGNFVPSVYAKEFDTLNFSLSQNIGKYLTLQFQAKNLTNPSIEQVYRSSYTGGDLTKTSYSMGIDYSLALSANFSF